MKGQPVNDATMMRHNILCGDNVVLHKISYWKVNGKYVCFVLDFPLGTETWRGPCVSIPFSLPST